MLKILLFTIFAFLLNSCKQGVKNEAPKGTKDSLSILAAEGPGLFCFRRVSGNENKDTSIVRLFKYKNSISGEMQTSVWEKDARRGTLKGSITNNVVKCDWTFMQEGVGTSLPVEFRMDSGTLLQKPPAYGADGSERPDDSAGYSIAYTRMECEAPGLYIATGIVSHIENGKDGYTATLQTSNGEMFAVVSIVHLGKNFFHVEKGDTIHVSGDTSRIDNQIYIRAKQLLRQGE